MEIYQSRSSPTSSLSASSPTFTSYSSENLGHIAARVVDELNSSDTDPFDDDFYSSLQQNHHEEFVPSQQDAEETAVAVAVDDEDDDESEFEFAVLCRDELSSPISADEIFANGQIRPMFPIFNTDLVFGYENENENDDVLQGSDAKRTMRLPLRKLLMKEKENSPAPSCSSSETDELDQIPPGTYCVWTPKEKEKDIIGKKSHSTGSRSKRFRIRDLINRSNSDGKDAFVFLTTSNHHQQPHKGGAGDQKRREKVPPETVNKKKSYLPYRKDLVGFFANVNSISRTVRPF